MNRLLLIFIVTIMSCTTSFIANAEMSEEVANNVKKLQSDWAKANYELKGDAQEKAFSNLVDQANQSVEANASAAELWIWSGIIKSSYAGVKGGLGALSLAKESKRDLEKALSLDPDALNGSAYTSLGALYSKVPAWPLGFGSDKKAKKLFDKALSLNPNGIDSNYFYAEFMFDEGEYDKAKRYYLLAAKAPARPDRPLADKGRHEEIETGLAKVNKKQH